MSESNNKCVGYIYKTTNTGIQIKFYDMLFLKIVLLQYCSLKRV